MKIGKIHEYKNGEPYVLEKDTVKNHICCDCSLVHFIHVEKVRSGKCTTRWYRDDYETEKIRRKKKK